MPGASRAASVAAARARGRTGKAKAEAHRQAGEALYGALYASREHMVADIAKLLGVNRQTVYRALELGAVAK